MIAAKPRSRSLPLERSPNPRARARTQSRQIRRSKLTQPSPSSTLQKDGKSVTLPEIGKPAPPSGGSVEQPRMQGVAPWDVYGMSTMSLSPPLKEIQHADSQSRPLLPSIISPLSGVESNYTTSQTHNLPAKFKNHEASVPPIRRRNTAQATAGSSIIEDVTFVSGANVSLQGCSIDEVETRTFVRSQYIMASRDPTQPATHWQEGTGR